MDMVAILLQYTRAQRDGIWELHLYYFSLMLPYFKDLATEVIQESLLRAKVLGQQDVKKFVQDRLIVSEQCDKPDVSIYEPVRKYNARTKPQHLPLCIEVVKHTKDIDQKTVMKADRNVLRRLITSYEAGRSVDLSSVLKHELLPVPVSLAEMNGTLRTGNNSELANVVTEDMDCPETIQLHATSSFRIIDGQALVVALGKPDAALTCGDLADTYVKTVLKAGSEYHRIDVVFDRYRDETIKGTTRTRKTARPIRRLVEGRDVPLQKNWTNLLSLADNKAYLSHFLSGELCSQAPVDKAIVVAVGFRDELEVKSSTGTTDLGPLKSTHEEADTRSVLHTVNSQFHTGVVSSRDTDVLLLLVSHFRRMQCQHLWMKSGTLKTRRYIPIDAVFNKLPRGSASSLLAFTQ